MMLIIAFLLLIFGTYAIIKPNGVSLENLKLNYSVSDLIRGWGIYSVTIAFILFLNSQYLKTILISCFLASIIWHVSIIRNRMLTPHHCQSIILNFLAIIITYYS